MKNLLKEHAQIEHTKDIKVIKAWLDKYHACSEEEIEENPIFSINEIEFTYFNSACRQDTRYEVKYREHQWSNPLIKHYSFEELIEMGLAEFTGMEDDEVYFMDEHYDFEIVYRSDILNDFLASLEA